MSNYTVHVGPDKRLELSRGLSGLHWVVNIVPKLRVWNREAAAVLLENPMVNLRNWGGEGLQAQLFNPTMYWRHHDTCT